MKIFAHRGWSAGRGENTLEAFKKSEAAGLDGVEFDVRFENIILSHDYTNDNGTLAFEDALKFLETTTLEILIEFKEYTPEFFARVTGLILKYGMADRTTVFAFPEITRDFPWGESRKVALGIISKYPHHLKRDIETYKPDMVLLGWGNKRERFLFKLVWNVLSLSRTIKKYPRTKFVAGVAYDTRDIAWLATQGLHGATTDRK
jgi:glycerophosphoryl diester phosphodiesterase